MTTTPTPSGGSWWIKLLCAGVPGDIRHEFAGNLAADRDEMTVEGASRLRRNLALFGAILNGVAQHAPLRPSVHAKSYKPHVAERATLAGSILWRFSGPLLLAGWLAGETLLLVLGGLFLVGAFGCLVALTATGRDPLPEAQQRFIAALLGGTLGALFLIVVFGLVTLGLLALASLFSSGLLAAFAIRVLVFVALATVAGVTGWGWVPEEWTPKRLVENKDVRHPRAPGATAGAPAPAAAEADPAPVHDDVAASYS